jgi:hypothetical protein
MCCLLPQWTCTLRFALEIYMGCIKYKTYLEGQDVAISRRKEKDPKE